jgi:cell wall assembly regulator SMI1
MDDVVDRLAQWLWKNCPKNLERLAPGLTDEQIAVYETQLGVTFPDGMRALYRWRNGVAAEHHFAGVIGRYSIASLQSVVNTQKIMNDLVDQKTFKTSNWWRKTWVPVFDKGTGDNICWDPRGSFSGTPGQVIQFWHTDHDRKVLAPSFDGYLTAYVESLELGVWRYSEDEGMDDDGDFEDVLARKFDGFPYNAIDFEGRPTRPPAPPPALVTAAAGRPVKTYASSTTYEVGDQVTHPQFGTGVVQAVEKTKAEILFSTERRILIHGRGGSEKLEKPKRIDHSKPDPPKF